MSNLSPSFLAVYGFSSNIKGYSLHWTDNSSDENFFEIQVSFGSFGWTQNFAFASANATSREIYFDFAEYGVVDGNSIQWRVHAVKGTSSGNAITVTERSAGSAASPVLIYNSVQESGFTAPTGLTATSVAGDDARFLFNWSDNTNKEDFYDIEFKKNTDADYSGGIGGSLPFNFPPGELSLAGFQPGQQYKVRVRGKRAVAHSGTSITGYAYTLGDQDLKGYSNEASFTMPALKAPTGMTVVQKNERTVTVSWTDNSNNENGYQIQYRTTPGTGDFITADVTAASAVTKDVPWVPNVNTEWRVVAAFNPGNNAAYILSPPTTPITFKLDFKKPTDVQVNMTGNMATGDSIANVSWVDNSAIETGYYVLAKLHTQSSYTAVAQVGPNVTTATVTGGFAPGTVYDFVVLAYYTEGDNTFESDLSTLVSATSKDGFTSAPYAPITAGVPFSYTLTTTTVQARVAVQISGLPDGLSFNSTSLTISGTPAVGGLFNASALAVFADGWVARQTLALRIVQPPAAPQKPFTLTSLTVPLSSVNVPLSALFSERDTEAAVRMSTSVGNVDIVLQPTLTPQTYANFMAYANDPDATDNFNNAVFHRVSPGFVVQGGGYKPLTAEGTDKFAEVIRKASPTNEPGISNLQGMISMAKSSAVNSATHDFFFNLGDNSSLDTVANNSFTAFGRVAGNGMSTTVQTMVNLPGQQYTVQIKASGTTAFAPSNPLSGLGSAERWPINDTTAPSTMDNTKVVKINSITSLPVLTYEITVNTDPGNVAASISGSNLVLQGVQDGTSSTITVTATDVDNNVTTQSFAVTAQSGFELPVITTDPQAQTVAEGADVTFSVAATGGSLNYQWRKNGFDIAGQTSPSLVLEDVTAEDIADYSVVVSNGATFVFSSAARLTVNIRARILLEPISLTRNYGTTASFTVAATGDATLTYQWFKGDDAISAATAPSYTINSLLMTDAGSYKVRVSNSVNTVFSSVATLTVNPVDRDNDGLYDHIELARSPATNPTVADTDGDGFVDGLEVGAGTDPTLATQKPGTTVFYAQKDLASVLGTILMKRIPGASIQNRLNSNATTLVPDLWLGAYELTNQQFASILQKAKELDLISIAEESGRKVVRYPKVAGEVVCYLANPAGTSPPSTDVDLDNAGSSFILPTAKIQEPASAISWHGAYLCTVVLNQVHGYLNKNVPASWSYSSVDGYQIPDYTAWELAGLGGVALGQKYPTGSTISTAKANYNNAVTGVAKKVGSYPAGKLGLFDMGGNLAEWIFQSDTNTPTNAYTRGGSFADPAIKLENSAHESLAKNTISRRVGVRLGLRANAAASFSTQPEAKFQRTDSPLTLTAVATGAPPLAYQWYKNNVLIKGKTSDTLTISSPVLADAGEYHVTVTTNGVNPVPSTKVKVALLQAFATPPKTIIAKTKGTSFEAKAQGAAGQVFTYQWKIGSSNVSANQFFLNPIDKKLVMSAMQPNDSKVYTCQVSLAGQPSLTTAFELLVMDTPLIPDFDFPGGTVSGSYNFTLPVDSDPTRGVTTWSVTGLPPGMTYNAATGVISGKPTASGQNWQVKITGRNIYGSSVLVTEELDVETLDGNAYGTYFGTVDRHVATGINDNLGGRLDVTIANTGTFTGKVFLGTKSHSFTGALDNILSTVTDHDPSATVLITRTGQPTLKLFFKIKLSDQTLRDSTIGELGAGGAAPVTTAAISGWRNNWNKVFNPPNNYRNLSGSAYVDVKRNVAFTIPVASVGSVGVPQGASYATALVDAGGVTTVSGRLADNTAITGTGYLSPTGQIAFFQALYLGKGSLLGKMTTATTTHIVSGTDTLSWLRKDYGATSRERSYKRGFSTTLTAAGGVYVAPTTGTIMAGLDPVVPATYPQNARLTFSQGGLSVASVNNFAQNFVITTANVVQMPSGLALNPQTVVFTPNVNRATGLFSGSFTVVNDDPTSTTNPVKKISRVVSYYGQIVPNPAAPTKGIGYGYFNMYGLPASGGVTTSNSDILSGKVVFDAAPVPPPVP